MLQTPAPGVDPKLIAENANRSVVINFCGIRGKAATDSDGKRPPNPRQSGHRFRTKAATLLIG